MKNIYRLFIIAICSIISMNLLDAQWTKVSEPSWVSARAFAISDTNIFVGTDNGVFRSTDHGTTWRAVNNGLTSKSITSLIVSGSNIFAGAYSGGVFLSTNNGANWSAVNTGITSMNVTSLSVCGINLFAGTSDRGVFLSNNNGANWINTGLTTQHITTFAISGTNIFVGTSLGGVFLSTNNGASWSAVNSGLTNKNVVNFAISGTNLFAGTSGGGVFLSTNNGTSWTAVNTGLPDANIDALAVSDSGLFVGTLSDGVFLSTNNGLSWSQKKVGLSSGDVRAFCVNGAEIFAGTNGGGIYRSINNGTNWVGGYTSLMNPYVNTLSISKTDLIASTNGGAYYSTNEGVNWIGGNSNLVNTYVTSMVAVNGNIFAGTYPSGLYLSTDSCKSWTAVNTGFSYQLFLSSGGTLYAGSYNGLYASDNNGLNWYNVGLTGLNVTSLIKSGAAFFAGTSNGLYNLYGGRVNLGGISSSRATITARDSELFVATDNGVYYSNNNGKNWVQSSSQALSGLATSNSDLFGFTSSIGGTVKLSTNNGVTWTTVNAGLTATTLNSLVVAGANIYAATNEGVWKRSLGEMTTVAIPNPTFPLDKAIGITTSPFLAWNPVNAAATYQIEVSTNINFNTTIMSDSGFTENNYPLVGLFKDSTYYWRVKAINSHGVSGWSTIFCFTTIADPPLIPILKLPLDSAQGIPINQPFSWYASNGTASYQLEVSTTPTFTSTIVNQSGIILTSYVASGLANNTKYYWRVNASNSAGSSAWSAIRSFTTSPMPLLKTNKTLLTFDNVGKYLSKQDTIQITNSTLSLLQIDSIYASNPCFTLSAKAANLNNSDTAKIIVTFTPSAFGAYNDTIKIRSNSSSGLVKIPLSGNSPAPILFSSKTDLAFPNKAVNDSSVLTAFLKNSSISAMTISSITTNKSIFTATSAATTVTGGDSTLLTVKFKPTLFGAFTDTVTIASDGGTKKIALSGSSPFPMITMSKTSITYGSVAIGKTKRDTINVINSSVNRLIVDSIYTKTPAFTVDRMNGTVGSDTMKVVVSFTPTALASVVDTLYLRNNSVQLLLKIAISGDSPVPVLQMSPIVYRKDTVAVGDSSSQSFVIHNSSINDLSYESIGTKTASFRVRGTLSGQVKANDSTVFAIQFKPASFGEFVDSLSVTSFGLTAKFPLMGSSPSPAMKMSVWSINFGNVKKDSTQRRSIVMTNASINKLRLDSLKTISTQFTIDKFTSPVFVSQKDSATFVIAFKPDTIKTYSDTVRIYSNQSIAMVSVPLTGNGKLTSVSYDGNVIPTVYFLNQNYPNPFNPSTTLSYNLPMNSRVSLQIFNILGQQVVELVNTEQPAGMYRVTWNANVSSGMYFYRIVASGQDNQFIDVKKMILMR
jgi:ligand-binding sensor domain-containing protein